MAASKSKQKRERMKRQIKLGQDKKKLKAKIAEIRAQKKS